MYTSEWLTRCGISCGCEWRGTRNFFCQTAFRSSLILQPMTEIASRWHLSMSSMYQIHRVPIIVFLTGLFGRTLIPHFEFISISHPLFALLCNSWCLYLRYCWFGSRCVYVAGMFSMRNLNLCVGITADKYLLTSAPRSKWFSVCFAVLFSHSSVEVVPLVLSALSRFQTAPRLAGTLTASAMHLTL